MDSINPIQPLSPRLAPVSAAPGTGRIERDGRPSRDQPGERRRRGRRPGAEDAGEHERRGDDEAAAADAAGAAGAADNDGRRRHIDVSA